MLIGLSGNLRSGKDATFLAIQELYPDAERVSFAEKIKDSAAQSLGISRELMDVLKNHENIHIGIVGSTVGMLPTDQASEIAKWSITMREYLQLYGTEGHREIFGDNFWVDQALPADTEHTDRLLVVTDMRFPNEIERVRELGGVCVKVERYSNSNHSNHSSEQNLDNLIDIVLDNTGDLDDLKNEVEDLMEKLLAVEEVKNSVWEVNHA